MKTVGQIIREKRRERCWTQKKLATKIGVTAAAIGYWENDIASPNIYAVWDMADVFGCTIDELCGRKEKNGNERTILYPKKWDDTHR